jgi:colanic acid/amylovoran biosynthesis protein
MKILILDSGNTYNYGSMMMVENVIHYYDEFTKTQNDYYVEMTDKIHQQRLIDATDNNNIKGVTFKDLIWCKKIKIALLISKIGINPFKSFVKEFDKVVFLGGDDLTEIYGIPQLRFVTNIIKIFNKFTGKVSLQGQTIGPFNCNCKKKIIKVLQRVNKLTVRDPQSLEYCKANNIDAVEIADFALLPLTKEEDDKSNKERNLVLFCPSEIMYRYSKGITREQFIEINARLCEYIIEQYKVTVVLLPHVYNDRTNGDIAITREIYNKTNKQQINFIEQPMLPYEIRGLINQCKFIIAERMHPSISGLECEVPSLVFSYGSKYEGIFNALYKIPELVIDIRNFSDKDELLSACKKIIQNIADSREELKQRIHGVNQITQPKVLKAIEGI